MKGLGLCCFAPHAPILVPEVGGRETRKIAATEEALQRVSGQVRSIAPETVVIVSPPHMRPGGTSGFPVKTGDRVMGSLERFGAAGVGISARLDSELVEALARKADAVGLSFLADESEVMDDWGALVPLVMLGPETYELVAINVSPYFSYKDHYRLGTAIAGALRSLERNAILIASGDLSHRLTRGAPSGYHPRGEEYDAWLVGIMREGDFKRLFDYDPTLIEAAGEDSLWSACVMAGTVDGMDSESEVLSYEGPFGVGYMVATVEPGMVNTSREMTPP